MFSLGTGTTPTLIERLRISSGPGGNGTAGWDNTNNGTEVVIQRGAGAGLFPFPQANLNIGSDVPGVRFSSDQHPSINLLSCYPSVLVT